MHIVSVYWLLVSIIFVIQDFGKMFNIYTATEGQLLCLKGIGPTRAKLIMEERRHRLLNPSLVAAITRTNVGIWEDLITEGALSFDEVGATGGSPAPAMTAIQPPSGMSAGIQPPSGMSAGIQPPPGMSELIQTPPGISSRLQPHPGISTRLQPPPGMSIMLQPPQEEMETEYQQINQLLFSQMSTLNQIRDAIPFIENPTQRRELQDQEITLTFSIAFLTDKAHKALPYLLRASRSYKGAWRDNNKILTIATLTYI